MASGVEVTGLREAVRRLERFGVEVADLKDAFGRIGSMVASDAQSRVHRRSGRLAGSIRPSRTKNKSVIRAGGASIKYAGPREFGWPARNIVGQRFLTGAAIEKRPDVVVALEQELRLLAHKYDLD